ncbi:MAG: response regulator [Verrucomicrobiaceae bacterium]|nr:response regulator [Verrucomicrobiaceae bacterium]
MLSPVIKQQGALVVEDNALQRASTVRALRRVGITTLHEAENGIAALTVIDRLLVPPAIVVLDLDMPGMDGIELVQQLAANNYRPAIIIASNADTILISAVETIVSELKMPLLGSTKKPLLDTFLIEALSCFDQGLHQQCETVLERVVLTPEHLQHALTHGEIQAHYQPKIAVHNSTLAGVEALARWHSDRWGSIIPARFIPLAEQFGLINQLTLCIIDTVLADMRNWRQSGIDLPVSINLSARSLADPDFLEQMLARIEAAAIRPQSIVFEITESTLFSDTITSLVAVSRLRLKGFGVSLDDYGTGFSSVQQLSKIPFTELKIDRSFVSGAPYKEHLRTILQSSIEMGKRLGLRTVAEGVETLAELRLLQKLHCDEIQGYLFARPMPSSDLKDWFNHDQGCVRDICRQGTAN